MIMKQDQKVTDRLTILVIAVLFFITLPPTHLAAREVEYKDGEISIAILPGEPTQIKFPGEVTGGFKKRMSTVTFQPQGEDLIVFGNEGMSEVGESVIVRLKDGRSYSLRIKLARDAAERDDVVRIEDNRIGLDEQDEEAPWKDPNFYKAPANSVAGFMREMMLVTEFGKKSISGYRVSDRYKGETLLNDGTMQATVENIFIGSNFWGYVINAQNLLDQTQKINPATFRIDGTRAISAKEWELAPKPLNIEQQVAGKDSTKVYVITKAVK